MAKAIAVDLTASQYTPFGKILYKWYYTSKYSDLRKLLESLKNPNGGDTKSSYGYPHHGGSHALTIFLSRQDMISFFEIAMESEEVLIPFFKPIYDSMLANPDVKSFVSRKIWEATGLNKSEYETVNA